MRLNLLAGAALAVSGTSSALSNSTKLSAAAQDLFDYSVGLSDERFDETFKYVTYPGSGQFSVRFTAWYLPGLLHRNEGKDLENAKGAIKAVLATQFTEDIDAPWYGTWRRAPEEPIPTPDLDLYKPVIYTSYDPNWREFVGSQLIQVVEEFGHLIGDELIAQIDKAMEIQAVGAMRRNGTFPDNLVTGYTNPAILRAFTVGWIGARTKNQTLIAFANNEGRKITELFKLGPNTFSEYNVPTYYGIDMWALGTVLKYGPKNATLTQNSRFLLKEFMRDVADHYNPTLGNLVGPYDRANARDLTQHGAVIGVVLWGLLGYDKAPVPNRNEADLMYDATGGCSIALVIETIKANMDAATLEQFITPFTNSTDRFLHKTIRDDLDTNVTRTATSWLSEKLMIGGMELEESAVVGGQFVPAIVHWASVFEHKPYPYISFFSLFPSATAIDAIAGKNSLSVSYPNTTQTGADSFQYMISGLPPTWNLDGNVVNGFENLPCLNVTVESEGLEMLPTKYGGVIYNQYYYNVTYVVPANFTGVPRMEFDIRYTC